MKRRIVTIIMTLCLLLSILPCECFAQSEGQSASTYVTRSVSLPSMAQSDPAMDMMYYFSGAGREGTATAPRLGAAAMGEKETLLYQALLSAVEKITSGEESSTQITLPGEVFSLTREELGLVGPTASYELQGQTQMWSITEEAGQAVKERVDAAMSCVYSRLLTEQPYAMYWHDKTRGFASEYSLGLSYYDAEADIIVTDLTAIFAVAKSYIQLHEGDIYYTIGDLPCEVDAEMVQRAKYAAANAAQVVKNNAGKGVFDTLVAYREYICGEVTYDTYVANQDSSTLYGDPWQLISVFDKDSETNVVCEGYAKAFKYLCDLTWTGTNPAVKCYLVSGSMFADTGSMSGSTGSMSGGPHMWNIVTIGEKNYLVDVTNCDTGTVGEGNGLFLRGASGSAETTYTVTVDENNSIDYTYDENTRALYDTELEISDTDFDHTLPEERPVGDVNGDYTLDVSDMARLFEHLSGEKPLKSEDLAYADVNGDTAVNILDYQALYQLIVLGA